MPLSRRRQSPHVKILVVNGVRSFFTNNAGEILLAVVFGIRLIFSRKKIAFRLFIFAIFFVLLFILNHMNVQGINPFEDVNVSNNALTIIFVSCYAVYVLFFEHD